MVKSHGRVNYVICATHRTGSNLLCTGLEDTGRAGAPYEFFMHLRGEIGPFPELAGKSRHDFTKRMFELGTTANGVFGIKMMWESLEDAFKYYEHPKDFEHLAAAAFLSELFPQTKYVYMQRKDKTRQAVSVAKAVQIGQYFLLAAGPQRVSYQRDALRYDEKLIAECRRRVVQHDLLWQEFFRVAGISPFTLVYEDFVERREETLKQVLDYLGIDSGNLSVLPPRLRRQSDSVNEEWVQRFERERSASCGENKM